MPIAIEIVVTAENASEAATKVLDQFTELHDYSFSITEEEESDITKRHDS